MRRLLFNTYSGPFVALGALVALVCLAGSWYISRLQAELTQAVRHDAVGMDAADDIQVQLRHLRVHTLVLVADRTDFREAVVRADFARVDGALQAVRQAATTLEETRLAERIEGDYAKYKENLGLDRPLSPTAPISDVALWSDAHHMRDLLEPCRELADLHRERMKGNLERSEVQTAWAGRVLFGLGFTGVLAGLFSGYITARTLNRRVARLSVRVQAVHAHLDQDVGALTVQGPPGSGDLDEQLDRVVGRVSAACRRLQEQERDLLRAEQLAAVGLLAAGVAHEIRNPLTGVKLLLQAAVRPENATALSVDRLQLLLQEVVRIERTVYGLMEFASTKPLDRHPLDLRTVVGSAVNVAQSRAEIKSVVVRLALFPRPLPAAVDRDQLLSLLTNLLFNAIDASPVGGEVGVSTTLQDAASIQVTVTDAGPGVSQLADRLFTPFATTKPTGTGLGLTIARRIAHEHGGALAAVDRPEGGACFILTLPTAEESYAETAGG